MIPYRLPWARPVETAAGSFLCREGWWLLLEEAGARGLGEAAPWPGFGGLARGLSWGEIGARLEEAAGAWVSGAPVEALLPALVEAPEAAHALECAALDLLARREGRALAALLGAEAGAVSAATHALVSAPAEAVSAVSAGFVALKVKVGAAPWEEEVARVRAIRAAVGPRARLRVDANGAWGRDVALAFAAAASGLGLDWLEQPVVAADVEGLALVRAQGAVPVAADEALVDAAALERALALGAADVVVLKPMFVGGLRAAAALARRARGLGARVCVTHALESSVGRAAAVALACALGPEVLEPGGLGGAAPDPWGGLTMCKGFVSLSPGVGLGGAWLVLEEASLRAASGVCG